MDQPWNTRSGESTDHMGPQPGQDLAEMQRARNAAKRDRDSVRAAQQNAETKRRVHLEERARDQRIKQFLLSKKTKIALGVGLVLLLAWTLGWPALQGITNPRADLGDLRSTQPQIALAANQALGGDSQMALTQDDSAWRLVYSISRGGLLYNGQNSSQHCSLVFVVSKDQPSHPILRWRQVSAKACR